MKKRRIRRENGFSLIEVMVALTILAISLGLILEIFSGGLRRLDMGGARFRAMLQAEALMNDLGYNLPLRPGLQEGRTDQGYQWTIDIKPYIAEMGDVDVARPLGELYDISIRINWQGRVRAQELTINSLRYIGEEPG